MRLPPLAMPSLAFSLAVSLTGLPALAATCPLPGSAPAPITTALQFAEGPVWMGRDWLFSDVAANRRYRLGTARGAQPVVAHEPSGYANGNALLPDGSLVSARHDRLLVRVAPDGSEQVLARTYQGRPLNSPNDVVVARDGAIWFTDPTFGIDGYGPQRAASEQPVRGVYRLAAGAAEPALMSGIATLPNGLAFSNDGRSLFFDDTADGRVHRLPIGPDGRAAGAPSVFAQAPAGADGLRVDRQGRVWVAGPKGVTVFPPGGGAALCALPLEAEHIANLAFGGADGRSVLVTGSDRVYVLRARERLR